MPLTGPWGVPETEAAGEYTGHALHCGFPGKKWLEQEVSWAHLGLGGLYNLREIRLQGVPSLLGLVLGHLRAGGCWLGV